VRTLPWEAAGLAGYERRPCTRTQLHHLPHF